jgi:hypothetical protein
MFLAFGSACALRRVPLKPRYSLPVRSWPWNEVMTATPRLYVIKRAEQFRVRSYALLTYCAHQPRTTSHSFSTISNGFHLLRTT